MKRKKLKKTQRMIEKAVRRAGYGRRSSLWVTALATIAGAVVAVLADSRRRAQLKEIAYGAKGRARHLAHDAKDRVQYLVHARGGRASEMPDGMVMDENPGPV